MKKLFILFLFGGFLWSCSSDDDNGGGDAPDNVSMLPTKVSLSGEDGTFDVTYSYTGNKISTMTYSSGYPFGGGEAVFQYDGDKIKNVTFTLAEGVITKDYTYSNNRISSVKEVWEGYGTTVYNYNWISDNHVKMTSGNNDYYTDFHLSNGNIVKVEDYSGGNVWETIYTVDNKNSPFKNVEGYQYLIEDGGSSYNRNNIIKDVTTAGNSTFITDYSYEYNAQGYPTKQIEQSEDYTDIMVITYNQ